MEWEVTACGAPCARFLVQPRWKPSLLFALSSGMRHLIHEARDPFFSFPSHSHLAGRPFPPHHDAIYRSPGRTSYNSVLANFAESPECELRLNGVLGSWNAG